MLEFIFFFTVLIQAFYYLFIFSRFSFSKKEKTNSNYHSISLIICAHNEAENLKQFLPYIINQDYPDFEIILVNDHSNDNTLDVMKTFKEQSDNIIIVDLNNNINGNKKNAVTQGIRQAKNEYLLFTDADCKPNSTHWIYRMSAHFSPHKKIVLGYGAYLKKKTWVNKLIRFETLLTAIQYFSYAKINLAYMGVGRNLAYTKTLFNKANGFNKHQHITSGDDDLFINQVANTNVASCYSKESFTYSEPHTVLKEWIYQKRRHISTSHSYKLSHKILLGTFYLSQFLFWFLASYLFIFSTNALLISYLFIFRIILQYIIYGFASKKLKEIDLLLYLPFLELLLIIIQMYIFIKNLLNKPTKWQI